MGIANRLGNLKKITMTTVYISVGSNVGDRTANLNRVSELLEKNGIKILVVSPVYETEPYGYKEQAWFYNQVIKAETELFAREFLELCQRLEVEIGREKSFKWGPRVIDIDIMSFGQEVINEDDFKVPHPFLHMRQFVLQPLNDIDPNAVVPGLEKTVTELLKECADASIVRRLM